MILLRVCSAWYLRFFLGLSDYYKPGCQKFDCFGLLEPEDCNFDRNEEVLEVLWLLAWWILENCVWFV